MAKEIFVITTNDLGSSFEIVQKDGREQLEVKISGSDKTDNEKTNKEEE